MTRVCIVVSHAYTYYTRQEPREMNAVFYDLVCNSYRALSPRRSLSLSLSPSRTISQQRLTGDSLTREKERQNWLGVIREQCHIRAPRLYAYR